MHIIIQELLIILIVFNNCIEKLLIEILKSFTYEITGGIIFISRIHLTRDYNLEIAKCNINDYNFCEFINYKKFILLFLYL